MSSNHKINKIENEYLCTVKNFNDGLNVERLKDRINHLNEKNPRIQQLINNKKNPEQKTHNYQPFGSILKTPPTTVNGKLQNGNHKTIYKKLSKSRNRNNFNKNPLNLNPLKKSIKNDKIKFDNLKNNIQPLITVNYMNQSDLQKARNFIAANKKNAFSAQKIGGFFEHNEFFTAINDTKKIN